MKDDIELAVKSSQERNYVPIYKIYPGLLHKGHNGSLTLHPVEKGNLLTISEYYYQIRVIQTYDSAINKTSIELAVFKDYPKWLFQKMSLILKHDDFIKYEKDFYTIFCGTHRMSFSFEMTVDGLNFLSIYYLIPVLHSFRTEFSSFIKNIKTMNDTDFVDEYKNDSNFLNKYLCLTI